MGYRVTVDTGGTFTDVVVADEAGRLRYNKAPTTTGRIFDGMSTALSLIAEEIGEDLQGLLGATDLLVYATTHATNAILEQGTARTAFFTTAGFPDVLTFREGGKFEAFNFAVPYPEPYVPRALTFEIPGRIGAEGTELSPLGPEAAREAIREALDAGVEAFAVSLIWSIANPAHELAVGALLQEEAPGVPFTLSHQLNPIIREYRRASSTAIDASLKPLMDRHFAEIGEDLSAAGFAGELLVVTSMGGCLHVGDIVQRPIHAVSSGPSMAPISARTYSRRDMGHEDIVVCDAGGTSFDVSLIQGGTIKTTRDTWLGPVFQGHLTGLASVEVSSIGSGGGSIAWVDEGGLLRVGPQSAGADPGPACYGRGGSEPTVSDAAAVLGYFDPDYFLGGRMSLDLVAAEEAVARVAAPLGLSVPAAALGIMQVATHAMVSAIREITVNQGVDPRECMVVAGGGAGGLNAVEIARELGCGQVLIPPTAATLSAAGAQFADIIRDFSDSEYIETASFDFERANAILDALSGQMDAFVAELGGVGNGLIGGVETSFSVEARYPYQVWELEVPLQGSRFDGEADVERMIETFHQVHERTFKVSEPGQGLECQYWKGRVTAKLREPDISPLARAADEAAVRSRETWFESGRSIETRCYLAAALAPGSELAGPAIIEERATTVVVPPGARARVTPLGSYVIDVEGTNGD